MPRGRPRKTDPDAVLETAMQAFWKYGFDGTSMNDVAEATGMAKPGIYATFGDKETLYARALQYYYEELGMPLLDFVENAPGRVDVVMRGYFDRVASSALDKNWPGGCFVANTLAECAHKAGPLADLAHSVDRKRRAALLRRMKSAIRKGELKADADPEALADFFSGQTLALAMTARAGGSRKTLDRMIDVALTALPVRPE